ncbi:MAG: HipA domain-containing protein [archaeon]|nr:HipA domain-containing protein [archaeon]
MHKDIPLIDLILEDGTGSIAKADIMYNEEHMPLGTVNNGEVNLYRLSKWWKSRSIPASRENLESFLNSLDIPCPEALLTKSMGLSLSDQYWVRPSGSDVSWASVNFFENDFSEDIGNLIFGHPTSSKPDLLSPDNTSDGIMLKKWKIIDGKRYLLKSTPDALHREVYNEVIASILCKALGIPHVEYRLMVDSYQIASACEDFISTSTEYVPAFYLLGQPEDSDTSDLYTRYVDSCRNVGVDIVPFLDGMIVLDYIIENYDRHFRNFGLIRDADTLEYLGPAPIFDTGSSLRSKDPIEYFNDAKHCCKPFKDTFDEQLELVSSFDWIDFDRLYGSLDEIAQLLSGTIIEKNDLLDSILGLLELNMTKLEEFVSSR